MDISRRQFLAAGEYLISYTVLLSICRSESFSAPDSTKAPDSSTIKANLKKTRTILEAYPARRDFLQSYLDELENRLKSQNSDIWLTYQNDRLNRIRWLLDNSNIGARNRMRLKVRPYDIPWVVLGMASRRGPGDYDLKPVFNGWIENIEKLCTYPDLQIEFTDRLADFCCLCQKQMCDGCSGHPEYGDYGNIFPQPNQISPSLSKNCEWVLGHLGLTWESVVSSKKLFALCVQNIPDPAAFPDFPEINKDDWGKYQTGIQAMNTWLAARS
jgi:hypothetical protein